MPRMTPLHWLLAAAAAIGAAWLAPGLEPEALVRYFREGTPLDRITLVLLLFVVVPPLFRRLGLPAVLGLMLAGVALGPYALGISSPESPTVDLFASLGRVFLMFVAGLEVDLKVFQSRRARSLSFGVLSFLLPLAGGVLVGRLFDFGWNASFLIGSLIASHTLLGYPILARLGLSRSEPVAVTLGATIFTDVASLLVLAVCIGIHTGGFSPAGLAVQLFELAVFGVIVLVGVPFVGVRFVRRFRNDEMALFFFTLLALLFASMFAHLIQLEDIVGAFFAGLAVNRVIARTSAAERIQFVGEALFIPAFFLAIGLRLDLPVFASTIVTSLTFVVAITLALFAAKAVAAGAVGRLYRYRQDETLTMWSLSLPQVAATLAAAYAAYNALDDLGDRLITETVLNSIIVLMVVTSVLGPVFTEAFGRRLQAQEARNAAA